MKIFRNRLLSVFLSFLMLFSMPTFANDGNVNPIWERVPWYKIAACGIASLLTGGVGVLATGVSMSNRDWENPYCDANSEYPNFITQDTYPSCPNCSVHWENNCYNSTNCHVTEQVCANGDGSQTAPLLYGVNTSYVLLIVFSAVTLIGVVLSGIGYYSYKVHPALPAGF